MKTLDAVSVVMPAYNRGDVITNSIESVLRQTHQELEIVVVDDGSADDTVDRVRIINDSRIRIIENNTNQGGSAARNIGIKEARYDIVAFQDSDDEWLPQKLEIQLAALQRHKDKCIGVFCGMLVLGPPNGTIDDYAGVYYVPGSAPKINMIGDRELLEHGSLISTQTFVGYKEDLLAVDGFDPELKALQDWDCFLRYTSRGKVAFVTEPLVLQRFTANSLTKSSKNRVLALERVIGKHEDVLRTMPLARARYFRVLSGGYRQLGNRKKAIEYGIEALKIRPGSAGQWLRLVHAALSPPSWR